MLFLSVVGYIGPHSLSLGNAYGAYFDRVEAIVFNPASASIAPRVMFSVNRYFSDYISGGFVFPNRILSFGVYASTPDDYSYFDIRFVLAKSFGTLNMGAGIQYSYVPQDSTVKPGFYAGVAFSPLDYFMFGFSVFNIDTPAALYSRIGMYVSNIPFPLLGRSLSFYGDMNVSFNSPSREIFNVGAELRPLPYLFLRLGYDGSGGWKGGLGYMYVYNTTDILFDLGVDSLFSSNRRYAVGITFKFLGYNVWVESSPKVISLVPGAEYNVVKICPRYNLPAEVDRWVLKITGKFGKVYRVYYGENSIPEECIYWQGTDEYGEYVGKGVYFYDFYVKTVDGRVYSRRGSLVNIKKGVGQ